MIRLLLLTLFFGIVFFGAERLRIDEWLHPDFPLMLGFFVTLGVISHYLIQLGFKDNRDKFVLFYLGVVVLRLLGAMVFLFVFHRLGTAHFQRFILNFFVLYLCYAGFEFYGVRANLRRFSG
jgi:hypothetical protein